MSSVENLDFLPGFSLEGFPNRDSTMYKELYNIPLANTVLRGTLRFRGFSDTIQGLQRLGLIDPNPHPILHPNGPEITWVNQIFHCFVEHNHIFNIISFIKRKLICNLLGLDTDNIFYENLKRKLSERLGDEERAKSIEDLGLLDDVLVDKRNNSLDTISHYLAKKLSYGPKERDLVVLRHTVQIRWPDNRLEERGINFVSYGDVEGHSAMALTVGYPAAIATKMILDGKDLCKILMDFYLIPERL